MKAWFCIISAALISTVCAFEQEVLAARNDGTLRRFNVTDKHQIQAVLASAQVCRTEMLLQKDLTNQGTRIHRFTTSISGV